MANIRDLALALPKPHFPWPIVTEEMKAAVLKTMDGGFLLPARLAVTHKFEENFRAYVGSKYAVAVNSGTSAILSILDGIGIQKGDEVIVPTYTFFATASPLLILGGVPIFADCHHDGNIDPKDVARKVTSKTKAIFITHQWGVPCDMDELVAICEQNKIHLLEDCSRAHGAKYKGRNIGTFGIAAAFSLQANKILSGVEGGIVITNDDTIYHRTILLSTLGQRCFDDIPQDNPLHKHHFAGFGLNHRIHPLSATIANHQLPLLNSWIAQKRIFVEQFETAVKEIPFLESPHYDENRTPAWYAFVMQFKQEHCKVSIEQFLGLLHASGLTEFERPGLLGQDIHDLPLFLNPSEIWPETFKGVVVNKQGPFPVAQKYTQNAVKLPVWVRSCDQDIVSIYIKGLLEVAKNISK